jgi:hypothetical protein
MIIEINKNLSKVSSFCDLISESKVKLLTKFSFLAMKEGSMNRITKNYFLSLPIPKVTMVLFNNKRFRSKGVGHNCVSDPVDDVSLYQYHQLY